MARDVLVLSCLLPVLLWSSCLPSCQAVLREDLKALQLQDDLFQNYSVYVTPRLDASQSVGVSFVFNYITLLSLDNLAQEMVSQVLIRMTWTDELLRWNPQDYDNINAIYPSVQSLWRPGFSLVNQLAEIDSVSANTDLATVLFNGQVLWAQTIILKSRCSLDMTRFPFDEQVCNLNFYMNRPTAEMEISDWLVIFSDAVSTNGEWEQVDISGQLVSNFFGSIYHSVSVDIKMRRLPRYYVINVVLPMLLLSSLCNVVFLVSAESGDKLTVALTLLLSEAVFLSYTSSLMPKTSDELPLLTLYLLSLLVVNTLSILATLFVLKTFKYSDKVDCPEPPSVLITLRNIFGPKPDPETFATGNGSDVTQSSDLSRSGFGKERSGDDPVPNSPNKTARFHGFLRALSQKVAHVGTFGMFEEKGDEAKNKISPESHLNKPVPKSVIVSPAGDKRQESEDLNRKDRAESIPAPDMSISDSTLVDLTGQDVYNDQGDFKTDHDHEKVAYLGTQKETTNVSNSLNEDSWHVVHKETANSPHQRLNWTGAENPSFAAKRKDNSFQSAWSGFPWPDLKNAGGNPGSSTTVGYEQEWLLISRALDRMFFLLFNLFIVAVSVYFFVQVV